jgi:hypothetical protein
VVTRGLLQAVPGQCSRRYAVDGEERLTGRILIPRGVFWGWLICTIVFGAGSIVGGVAIARNREILEINDSIVDYNKNLLGFFQSLASRYVWLEREQERRKNCGSPGAS